jgi:uncharacterized protein YqhQ
MIDSIGRLLRSKMSNSKEKQQQSLNVTSDCKRDQSKKEKENSRENKNSDDLTQASASIARIFSLLFLFSVCSFFATFLAETTISLSALRCLCMPPTF